MIDTDAPLLTSPDKAELYRSALEMLNRSRRALHGGRHLRVSVLRGDFTIDQGHRSLRSRARRAARLDVLVRTGFKTEIAFTHWLAKAHHGDRFIDIVYSSGNAVAEVMTSGSRTRWTKRSSAFR
jgi:hypothetical protein